MGMYSKIDWKRVGERLRCPICGEPASLEPGTDGTEASHTHRFHVSKEMAMQLSAFDADELREQIAATEAKLEELEQALADTPEAAQ